ncbi:hypothetical protein CRENBAI_020505 [Crenichthys baileyi]|uniref:Uncharacterized protein n=1 Tax=Crenichthys baileyi TaxID=28760 RepID=A0AAV9RIN4_9TELE
MFLPNLDLADKQKDDALDRWVERQKEEAMRNLPTDLKVQRVQEGCSVPPPQLRRSPPASVPAAKPSSSSRRRNRQSSGVNSRWAGEEVVSLPASVARGEIKVSQARCSSPIPSSARCFEATPEELEEGLRFFARQIKSFRKTSFLYFSPEQMQRIKQMEEDYETAIRLFYCRPPSPTPSHMSAAAEQPTSGLQSAAASSPRHVSRALLLLLSSPRHVSRALLLLLSSPRHVSRELLQLSPKQSTPGLQPAADFPEGPMGGLPPLPRHVPEWPEGGLPPLPRHVLEWPEGGLPPLPRHVPEGPVGGLPPRPGPEHLLGFLWGVPTELRPDARADSPQPGMTPDPKSASTSSTCCRGRRKRGASAQAPAHATEGLGDASAAAHTTEGPGNASASAHATESFVLVLTFEPRDEWFEEEALSDPVP